MTGLGKIALTLITILAYRNRNKLSDWLKLDGNAVQRAGYKTPL
jgi:hypothetical protein